MSVKLLYALEKETDNIVYIKDAKNGLSCNCYCPECKSSLVAKNGGKLKEYHFAHENNSSCSSGETYLHFLSKIVLSEMKEFFLPEGYFDSIKDFIGKEIGDTNKYFDKFYPIVNCYIEKKIQIEKNFIRPDIILELNIDGKIIPFLIEVAVNHFIENNKLEYIKSNKLNCIEIDLNNFKNEEDLWDKEILKKEVIKKERLNWINQSIYNENINVEIEKHQNQIIEDIKKIPLKLKGKTFYCSGLDGFYYYLFENKHFSGVIKEVTHIVEKNESDMEFIYLENNGFYAPIKNQYPYSSDIEIKNMGNYLKIVKCLYFFKYNNPLLYIEDNYNQKFCMIFSNNKELIKKLHEQFFDVIVVEVASKIIDFSNFIDEMLFKSEKQLMFKLKNDKFYSNEKSKAELYFLPYNRYELEKEETLKNLIGKKIKIKNQTIKDFIIKNIEFKIISDLDYYFEITTDDEEKIIIANTDKLKKISNKFKKLEINSYFYYERSLTFKKIRTIFDECYVPLNIINY